jgi:hypothetical protein
MAGVTLHSHGGWAGVSFSLAPLLSSPSLLYPTLLWPTERYALLFNLTSILSHLPPISPHLRPSRTQEEILKAELDRARARREEAEGSATLEERVALNAQRAQQAKELQKKEASPGIYYWGSCFALRCGFFPRPCDNTFCKGWGGWQAKGDCAHLLPLICEA